MHTTEPSNRRRFLRATTVAGVAGLFERIQAPHASAAEGGSQSANKEAVAKLLAEMEAKGRQMLSVPRKDGQFLNLLIKSSRARNVLEVGTSHGYSAIWIGLGLEETDGRMTTLEIRPERAQLARGNLGRAGLSGRVTVREGDAHRIVPALDGVFDFVFLDADKEGQLDYFNRLFPGKLAPGAIIAVHNAIRMRDSMKDYMDMIVAHPQFDTVTLSLTMEDGFEVSYRHRA